MGRRSNEGHHRRINKLKARIASPPEDHTPRCTVPDPITGKACGRPTARAAKQGLSSFHCRYHVQHRARHGSHWCKSIRASNLRPYLRAALSYVDLHCHRDVFIGASLAGLQAVLADAPPTELVTRLRGKSPKERALQCLARLHDRAVPAQRILATALAIYTLIEAEPARFHRTTEYRQTQIGKAMLRLGGGSHKVWEVKDDAGRVIQRTELHANPPSSGRMLRVLGTMIEAECELVIEKHFATVLAFKIGRDGRPAVS